MKKIISVVLSVMFLALLTVGASGEEYSYSDDYDWKRFEGQNVTIKVFNWGEYISVDDGEEEAYDTNREFEELTGINVEYTTFASNETLYAKLRNGGASYDVITPSDYMISRMIEENMLLPLDFDNIPNYSKIMDNFKNPDYDPKNEYSVPYLWGTVGLIYNKTMVGEDFLRDVEEGNVSWSVMWDKDYEQNMFMFSNSRDAFAISLFRLGYSVNTTNEDELREAAYQLTVQKDLVQAYVMDEIFDKMGGGEASIAPYYAGDAITMMADTADEDGESPLGFVIPREGTNLFVDAMCIPSSSQNKEAAEMYINFMCETVTAQKNCEYVGYSTPHAEAYENLDEETKNSEIIYPSDEVLENTEVFVNLPDDTTRLIDSLWTELMSKTGSSPWLTPVFLVAATAVIFAVNLSRFRRKKQREMNEK